MKALTSCVVGALLTGLMLPCTPGYSQPVSNHSANSILPGCRVVADWDPNDPKVIRSQLFEAGFCAGIVDGLLGMAGGFNPQMRSCVPSEVNVQQAAKLVVQFLDLNPQALHRDFRAVVVLVLRNTWPCKD